MNVYRLKRVINSVISEEQSAYLSDRNILDGPLITNEIISWVKNRKLKAFFFKIDFEKAFDTISWNFIDTVLQQMNFPDLWRLWIKGIFASSRASVLVNGSPTTEFSCFRGVRQGDPLSPFIFILAMEAFSSFMTSASAAGLIKGIQLPNNGPNISHLIFADDVMLLGTWEDESVININRLMRCFFLISGLKINLHKSCLYGIGTTPAENNYMSTLLGCNHGSLPFVYLGLKVGGNMNRYHNWLPVIETFQNRLSLWKATTLSIGGRLTLIKSVIDSLPLYYFALYQAPGNVIDKLEKLRRRFLWGGTDVRSKMHWVKWEIVTKPVSMGGLGLNSLRDANHSLLTKWAWRFKSESERLWRKVVMAIHYNPKHGNFLPIRKGLSGVWQNIVKKEYLLNSKNIHLCNLIVSNIGNGWNTQFWTDSWVTGLPLKSRFSALFGLEKLKGCSVRDRLDVDENGLVNGPKWIWAREPSSDQELAELAELNVIISQVNITDSLDTWGWTTEHANEFSVKEIKTMIQNNDTSGNLNRFEWNRWVPRKVNIFGWRMNLDRLPTKAALARRNITMDSVTCPLCCERDETAEHIFGSCYVSSVIWHLVSRWLSIPPIYAFTISDLLQVHKHSTKTSRTKNMIHAIILTTCWHLWNLRNEVIFSGRRVDISRLLADIKAKSFLWIKHRAKISDLEWAKWCNFNFL
ncbi:putative RNA-directed DNA polymerase [Helianthus annuus]|nr:putative RNA-directed DNA polymerase [Helianthus annuus]